MTNQEKLIDFVLKCAKKYNINRFKSKENEICTLATMVGPLHINMIEVDRNVYNIYMCFDKPNEALEYFNCDIETGSWDVYQSTLEDAKYVFDFCMQKVANLREI